MKSMKFDCVRLDCKGRKIERNEQEMKFQYISETGRKGR